MNTASYETIFIYQCSNINTFKIIYFVYTHLIMKYGIIFCGNSKYSETVFQLQKKIVITMTGTESRTSSKHLFQALETLTALLNIHHL